MLRIPTIHYLTHKNIPTLLTIVVSLAALASVALAAQPLSGMRPNFLH